LAYKKQNWLKFGRQGEIVEIIMRDQTNAKIESFRCNSNESYNRALRTIADKYGFNPNLKNFSKGDNEMQHLKNMMDDTSTI